jgi:alpha-glucosidase
MAGKSGRELPVDFSFLKAGDYTIEYFRDGINADRCAVDYKKITKNITAQDKMKIKLADGGGWAARIYRKPKPNRGG